MYKTLLALLALVCSYSGMAQNKDRAKDVARIEGIVTDAVSDKHDPIGFATVFLSPQGSYTTTETDGSFVIKNVAPGKVTLKIDFIGMEPIDTTFTVIPGKVYQLAFRMRETSFRLEELTVSATQSASGKSTSSKISRQAMDHLQTSSMRDIMQLLPGASLENSSLSNSNIFSIRTIEGASSKNTAMNSLGTAIMVDGAPLSNNANMQALAPTVTGATGAIGGGTSPNTGVDLRTLSTDNVEDIEVIRGIASVEYGDMTSGVVSVRSKTGVEPWRISFKTNPHTYQASVAKGLSLGKHAGTLNLYGDYAYNTTSLRESYAFYQRFNVKGAWAKMFDQFSMNTTLALNFGKDTRKRNPNDTRTQLSTGAREIGFRVTNGGIFSPANAGWLKNIKYNVAFSYTDKYSFNERLLGNAFSAYSMSLSDGAVLSNRPGMKVYDTDGKELTNIHKGEEHMYTTFLPNEYFAHYDVYGKELSLFAKVNATFNKRWEKTNNQILVGADYRLDGNMGRGTVYDLATPPLRTGGHSAYRPRKYSDIPFVNHLGIYLEDSFTQTFGRHDLMITAGARFDYVNGKTAVTPRINASMELVPEKLFLRGGYGINAKAPTVVYLYPQLAYFDFMNFSNIGVSNVPEEEQVMLTTTRVFDVTNKDLKMAKNAKSEIGFNWIFNRGRMKVYVTAYQEKLKDGYTFGRDLDCFKLVPYEEYKVAQRNPGGIPLLELEQTYNMFAMCNKPMNSISTTNRGLEYEIDLGRINAIRTSFYINGAWMKTSSTNTGYTFSYEKDRNNLENHIGVYEKGLETYCQEKINTRVMITHNIPKIGFVISLTANIDWKSKMWTEYGNDTMFEKYISYKDGKAHDFDPAMKDDPEFAYMFPALDDTRFIAETYQPTLFFNFSLSKEIGKFLTASFYVNNLFNSRPMYESKRTPGSFTTLGVSPFFGFDFKVTLR